MAAAIPSDLPSGIRLPRRGPDVARRGKALKERPYAVDLLRWCTKGEISDGRYRRLLGPRSDWQRCHRRQRRNEFPPLHQQYLP